MPNSTEITGKTLPVQPQSGPKRPEVMYSGGVRWAIEQWLLRAALRKALAGQHSGPLEPRDAMDGTPRESPGGEGAGPDVAALLEDVVRRRPGAESELLEIVYVELRAIAGSFFKVQNAAHTLQPTALVHEAFLKMMGGGSASYENRAHFIGVAAKAMRQVLIGHARARRAAKRGGDAGRVSLSGIVLSESATEIDALDVHELLERLARIDERQARIVELRFFAGLSVPETALVLGVSDRTVVLDWRLARAWLRRELSQSGAGTS